MIRRHSPPVLNAAHPEAGDLVAGDLACPARETLVAILCGETQVDEPTEAHLRHCTRCQTELDRLTGAATLESIRDQLQSADRYPFLDGPERAGDLGTLSDTASEAVFWVLAEIGRGGMGVVFRAVEAKLDREVAIKVLLSDGGDASLQRFSREARSAAAVTGDHVVSVHASGVTRDGRPYLVMPWIDGDSLADRIDELRDAPRAAAEAIAQLAAGLESIHQAGLIHRDIKPANALFDRATARYRLTDFGLARHRESGHTLTQASVLAGTPRYMSPEQAAAEANLGVASDVYSLGITLYETISGVVPFQGKPLQILEQHRNTEALRPRKLNPSIPRNLERICLKAIAKEPSRRYASAAAFRADLLRFLDGRPILAKDAGPTERVALWCRRNRTAAALLAMVAASLLLGILGVSVMWYRATRLADRLQNTSQSLRENQLQLRQSVSDFQEKVFSRESLHWQMSPEFRSEMFGDVLAYLERFETLEPLEPLSPADVNAGDDADSKFDADPIARDYMMIARVSIQSGDDATSGLALARALRRLRSQPADRLSPPNAQLLAEAAVLQAGRQIAQSGPNDTHRQGSQATTGQREGVRPLVNEALAAAERSRRGQPGLASELTWLWAQHLKHRLAPTSSERNVTANQSLSGNQNVSAERNGAIDDTLEQIEALIIESYAAREQADFVHVLDTVARLAPARWQQIDTMPAADRVAAYVDFEKRILVRAKYHCQYFNHPTARMDQLVSRNQLRRARALWQSGQIAAAFDVADRAAKRLANLAQMQAQNLSWQRDAALGHLLLRDVALANENFEAANEASIAALRKTIDLKTRRPKALPIAASVIRQFKRKAEISRQLQQPAVALDELYYGAQDCRLLADEDEDIAQWAFSMRMHLLGEIAPHYRDYPDAEIHAKFLDNETRWAKQIEKSNGHEVFRSVRSVLEGKHRPPPPDLPDALKGFEIGLVEASDIALP
ncbi:MAG: serine/threonine-protein kinase [Planctomycetota bacterium]